VTIYYPDVSAYEAGIPLTGTVAACIKATEGTGWLNGDYSPAVGRATAAGAFPFAYHFLHAGAAAAQAQWCYSHVGKTGLMLDFEPTTGSVPSLADAAGFIDAYRGLGGICNLTYLPHWYWQQIGSPGLSALIARGQSLVSSDYTGYSDSGPGWQPYGGMAPVIWQYTSTFRFNGWPCDFNAYRGTVAELETLVTGAVLPFPPPVVPVFPYPAGDYLGVESADPHCHSGYYAADRPHVQFWQQQLAYRGWVIAADGIYGAQSHSVCAAFQREKGLAADGKVGPVTWHASWADPVT
jgi:Glycosyl hydrolases family 25/Putative peptidoglycan binding domain